MYNIKYLSVFSIISLLIISGCQSYLERHDGVTSSAGEAHAVNEAKLVVDPWNPNSENTEIDVDGKRASDAIERYRNANSGEAESIGEGSLTTD